MPEHLEPTPQPDAFDPRALAREQGLSVAQHRALRETQRGLKQFYLALIEGAPEGRTAGGVRCAERQIEELYVLLSRCLEALRIPSCRYRPDPDPRQQEFNFDTESL